jgi:hypothetical protein
MKTERLFYLFISVWFNNMIVRNSGNIGYAAKLELLIFMLYQFFHILTFLIFLSYGYDIYIYIYYYQ